MNYRLNKVKRIICFVPVWACLILLSVIRDILFIKVKTDRKHRQRDRFDKLCQRLYAIVRNPFRISISPWIPPYFLPRRTCSLESKPIAPELFAKIQQLIEPLATNV